MKAITWLLKLQLMYVIDFALIILGRGIKFDSDPDGQLSSAKLRRDWLFKKRLNHTNFHNRMLDCFFKVKLQNTRPLICIIFL